MKKRYPIVINLDRGWCEEETNYDNLVCERFDDISRLLSGGLSQYLESSFDYKLDLSNLRNRLEQVINSGKFDEEI